MDEAYFSVLTDQSGVKLWVAGQRTWTIRKILLVTGIITITVLGSIGTMLPGLAQTFGSMFSSPSSIGQPACLVPTLNSTIFDSSGSTCPPSNSPASVTNPQTITAANLPNIQLPQPKISGIDRVLSTGVTQHSADNLTLYNSMLRLQLVNDSSADGDSLRNGVIGLHESSSWGVEVQLGSAWVSLLSLQSRLSPLATNETGTYVLRTTSVGLGSYEGILETTYAIRADGSLEWTLEFTPATTGNYRLDLTLSNATTISTGTNSAQLQILTRSYTLSWSKVPLGFNATSDQVRDRFVLNIDLGNVVAKSKVVVDPSLVGTGNNIIAATSYPYQHDVYQDPKTGYYWVFYQDYNLPGGLAYKYSIDGANWYPNPAYNMSSAWSNTQYAPEATSPGIYFFGENVLAITGIETSFSGVAYAFVSPTLRTGTIVGNQINWGQVQSQVYQVPVSCYYSTVQSCVIVSGIRYMNAALDSLGRTWISFNEFSYSSPCSVGNCGTYQGNSCPDAFHPGTNDGFYVESYAYVIMFDQQGVAHSEWVDGHNNSSKGGCYRYDTNEKRRSVILPTDHLGTVGDTVVLQAWNHTYSSDLTQVTSTTISLIAQWTNGLSFTEGYQLIEPVISDSDSLSGVSDLEEGTHFGADIVYAGTDGNITFARRSATGSGWSYQKNIFKGISVTNPTITSDYSTNDVYAFALQGGSNIVMRMKTFTGNFTDRQIIYPVTQRTGGPIWLESNFASASASNSTQLTLLWSEPAGSQTFNVQFASIPIQIVWSPYGLQKYPWDGSGLAPFGQYFQNEGESVSPSTGMLTVEQTDLSVIGRGLNLAIARVYTEPNSFLNNQPYNYESYPWAPMGDGWQLNFPWMTSTSQPLYLHLSDGQGYRIPSSFWTGLSATFENHYGLSFRLTRYINGTIIMYDRAGTAYDFGTSPNHSLTSITDSTGNNTITFAYTNSLLSCITDTVGRAFTFQYSSGLLQTVNQVSGTCSLPGSTLRTLSYANNGQSLTSETDPIGRITRYSYNAVSNMNIAPWLLSLVTYPTSWLTNFTYISSLLGTQATTYRIKLQLTAPSLINPTRQFAYAYALAPSTDQVSNTTVTTFDGSQIVKYTKYAFSFSEIVKNTTDVYHNLLTGDIQTFSTGGSIPKETIIVPDGSGHIGSYTNYYSYDLWGNQIYSRQIVNNSTGTYQESFSTNYNNGEPPGFYAFEDSFSQNQGSAPDNAWNATGGIWGVSNGVYNGTYPIRSPPQQQEANFARSDIGKSDITVQARVYINRVIATTDQRVGIVVHNPTNTLYKWMLVLHNATAGQYYLQLTDEFYGGWPSLTDPGSYSCPIVYNVWWTFNMTVHGLNTNGWATYPGQATPCTVSRTFSSSSPAISGTGFGVYAGGFSALFDDVLVTTVSSRITTTSFTNAFVQGGAPGPTGLNTWLVTSKPPGPGWNTTANWLPATSWTQAYAVQNYGSSPWNSNVNGWTDNSAQWIWGSRNSNFSASADPVWFRRIFSVTAPTTLTIQVTADNSFVLYVDGVRCAIQSDGIWQTPRSCTTQSLQAGLYHVIAVNATNGDGQSPTHPNPDPAGFLLSANSGGQIVFRTDGVASRNIVELAGSAQLSNGPGSLSEETYRSYLPWGGLNQTRQLYGGDASPTNVTISAWPVNDPYGRSWGLSVDQPLPVPWWSPYQTGYEVTPTQNGHNYTYTTFLTNSAGAHYVEFGISGFVPTYEWYVRIYINGGLRAQADVGRFNHLRAYIIAGTQWYTSSQTYDTFGNPRTTTDKMGNVTNYAFSATYGSAYLTNQTRVIRGTPNIAVSTLYSYNFTTGNALSITDPMKNMTSYTNDNLGRTTSVTYPTQPNLVLNPGFEAGDFRGWSETGMQVPGYTVHSGSYSAMPTYNNPYYSAFTLQQNLGPITGNRITSISFWQYGGCGSIDTAYVLYSDGTNTPTTLPILGQVWAQQTLSYNSAKTVIGIEIVQTNPAKRCAIIFDDFVVRAKNDFVAYTYNDAGNYVDILNENGWTGRQIYDGLGRQTVTEKFLSGVPYSNATTSYNWMDSIASNTDPLMHTSSYQYDALGRSTKVTQPDGNSTQTSYNGIRSWILTTDQYGNHRCITNDRLGRTIAVIEFSDSSCTALTLAGGTYVTNYFYDYVGNLVGVTTANGAPTTYVYDNLNRLIGIGHPDGTFESYTYDRNGNVVRKVDQANTLSLVSYDSLNRLLTATYCGTNVNSDSYTYDMNGNVLTAQNQNVTLSNKYDARNRILNETYSVNLTTRQLVDLGCSGSGGTSTVSGGTPLTYTVAYTYNGEQMSTITYPTISQSNPDITVRYGYDGIGRVTNVTQLGSSNYFAKITYYKNNQIRGIQYGNGLLGNYTYDSVARTLSISLTNPNSHTTMMLLNYNYNRTGTVASVTGQVNQATLNEQYRYDPLQRLTNATVVSGGGTTTLWYQYDNVGNRLAQSVNNTLTTYTYNNGGNPFATVNANNELTASSTPGMNATYTYDPDGNLVSRTVKTTGTTTWTYSWNSAHRLVKVTNGTGQALYAYDSQGRMIEALEGGPAWYFAYQGTKFLYKNLLSTDNYEYVYSGYLRIALDIDQSSYYYFHMDALGSTRGMTYQDATYVYINNYQPFGLDNGRSSGSFASRATDKFAGNHWSAATGLYYDFQRWYDPSIGRFISEDPMAGHVTDPQSLDPYAYVENAPTSYTDPAGMADCNVNPLSWGGCLVNAGSYIENGWNGLPDWAKAAIIIAVIVVVIIATLGIAAPELLPAAAAILLTGDVGILGGAAGICEDDPEACVPPPPPPTGDSGDITPVTPPPIGNEGANELDAFAKTVPKDTTEPYTLQNGATLRRYFGGDSGQWGKFWTTATPAARSEAQSILGLPVGPAPIPTNTAEFVVEGYFPAGSTFLVGQLPSGATQVLIDNPASIIVNPIIRSVPL